MVVGRGVVGWTYLPPKELRTSQERIPIMIEKVYDHILKELQLNTRTDTIFILTSVVLNFIILEINSALVSNDKMGALQVSLLVVFLILSLIINFVAIFGLQKGKNTRHRLLTGLMKMYKDQGVDGYYDMSLISNYDTRYVLFTIVIVALGAVSLIVPILTWVF